MSGAKTTLSLCMIVKDEELYLERCLASVAGHVDEMIIIDTGSRDRTVDIAQGFKARVHNFTWTDDFSAARNFSITRASGDWILVLDADECLAVRDAAQLRPLISRTMARGIKLVQRSYLRNGNFVSSIPNPTDYEEGQEYSDCVDVSVIRLFRNDARIRYRGRVHEFVEPAFEAEGLAFESSSMVIHHFGKVGDPLHLENKKLHYLDLGRQKAREHPHDAIAHFELGIQLFELKRYEECIPFFQKARALKRNLDVSLFYLAKASHLHGNVVDAQRYYEKYLTVAGNNDKVLFDCANFRRDQGQLQHALKLYQRTVAINPRHSRAVFNMGGVYIRLGQIDRGFDSLKEAIRLNPDSEMFYEHFGRLAVDRSQLENAATLLQSILARFPDAQRCASVLAAVYSRLKRFDLAVHWAARAIQITPDDPAPYLTKANAEFSLGQSADAEESYAAALRIDPGNLDSMINLAAIVEDRGEFQAAEQWYQRILEKHPDHPQTLKRYGRLAARTQPATIETIAILERACRTNPGDMGCVLMLSELYERHLRFNDAMVLYREAAQRNPKFGNVAKQKIEWLASAAQPRSGEIP